MRKVIIAILVMLSSSAFAQFNLSSGIGYGIQVNSKLDYTLFQTTVSVEPQFQFDKFSLVSQSLAMISDSASNFYTGLKAGYRVWQNINEDEQFTVSGHALLGSEGRKLLGGGVAYKIENIELNIDCSQEYLSKSFISVLSLNYNLQR